MSTGYSVRTRARFTVRALRSETERVLAEIAPGVDVPEIVVVPTLRDFTAGRERAARASDEMLDSQIGEPAPLRTDGVLMTPDAEAATGIGEVDVGYPEDPEAGRWFEVDVSVDRRPAARLLAVAVAVSASTRDRHLRAAVPSGRGRRRDPDGHRPRRSGRFHLSPAAGSGPRAAGRPASVRA